MYSSYLLIVFSCDKATLYANVGLRVRLLVDPLVFQLAFWPSRSESLWSERREAGADGKLPGGGPSMLCIGGLSQRGGS